MKAELILFQAMLKLAKEYNPNDMNEWGEKHSTLQQSEQIAQKLTEMGYCIRKGIVLELKDERELTTNNGE